VKLLQYFAAAVLIVCGLVTSGAFITSCIHSTDDNTTNTLTNIIDDSALVAIWLHDDQPVTDAELKLLLAKPLDFHRSVARTLLSADGLSETEIEHVVATLGESEIAASKVPVTAGACSQNVEHRQGAPGAAHVSHYQTFNDPNRGREYLYYFRPLWCADPDNIRWDSSSARVTWALWAAYGGLAGSQLCSQPHRLLVGDRGAGLAGGPENVRQHLVMGLR